MQAAIKYLLTMSRDHVTHVETVPNDMERLFNYLCAWKKLSSDFELVYVHRMIIPATRKPIIKPLLFSWDDHGIVLHDEYGSVIDSWFVPEPKKKKKFRVTYWEKHVITDTIEADSKEEADRIADQMLVDGELDPVMDGDQDDSGMTIEEI